MAVSSSDCAGLPFLWHQLQGLPGFSFLYFCVERGRVLFVVSGKKSEPVACGGFRDSFHGEQEYCDLYEERFVRSSLPVFYNSFMDRH